MNKAEVMRAIARKLPWKLADVRKIRIEYMLSDGKPRILELVSELPEEVIGPSDDPKVELKVSYDVEEL